MIMKWKTKDNKEPVIGSLKHEREFCWLPTEAENGYTYWLEKVHVIYVYSQGFEGMNFWNRKRILGNL